MEELAQMIYSTVTQHIPQSEAWIPYVGTGLLGLVGLVIMLKGAKLAPAISTCLFIGLGAAGGAAVTHLLHTLFWPSVIVGTAAGLVLGLLFFRVWLAVLVATCFIGGSLSLYSAKVLAPYVGGYTSQNLAAGGSVLDVTVPQAGDAATVASSTWQEAQRFWGYLAEKVPSFQSSFWAIVLSTGLAGLVFGLLLPRPARALCAATFGTLCFFVGLTMVLKMAWPGAVAELSGFGAWLWVVVAGVWALSLVYNFLDVRRRRPARAPSGDEPVPVGKTATA